MQEMTLGKVGSNEVREVKEKLASFERNYILILSRKTNLSRPTVSKFFNEHKIKSKNMLKIFDAALDLILAWQKEWEERTKRINQTRQD